MKSFRREKLQKYKAAFSETTWKTTAAVTVERQPQKSKEESAENSRSQPEE